MTHALPRRALMAAPLAAPLARPALAQPGRTARILVGFPPGGSVDVTARLLAERLRGRVAPTVVENRTGAAGRLAIEELKRSEPDGTTILLTPASMVTIFPTLYAGRLRYDVAADLIPVTPVCIYPFAVAVGPGAPGVTTMADLRAFVRGRPETPYASPAAGSAPHFIGVELGRAMGAALTHVPYRGAAPAIQDAVAGQIPMVVNVLGDLVPHHGAGRLKVLAVTAPARVPQLTEVPTIAEAGFPDLVHDEWYGLFLPARTSATVVDALNAATAAALADPAMLAALDRQAFAPLHLSPAAYAERVRAETARWAPIVAASGFRPEE